MKVLYINLEKDIKRRNFMEQQLKEIGFEYERIPAVDGRALSEIEVSELYDSQTSIKYNKKDLTRGEIGCALSHKKCHEIARDYEYTLILEDDVALPKNFKEIVDKQVAKNNAKKRWDYLQFDYPKIGLGYVKLWIDSVSLTYSLYIYDKSIFKKFLFWGVIVCKGAYVIPITLFEWLRDKLYVLLKTNKAALFYRPLYHAGCYIITLEGCKKVCSVSKDIIFAADRIHNQARLRKGLKVRAFCPRIVYQKREEFGSSIQGIKNYKE